MSKQVIVVEGTHDESKIKEVYPNSFCVVTNGSQIPNETLDLIEELSKTNEIIIFTDPDSPGERIRSLVLTRVPNASQAFIKKDLCISKNHKKVGVEHATAADIKSSLENVLKPSKQEHGITMKELCSLGLVGENDSQEKRFYLSSLWNMGKPNGKTFLKRCNAFGITLDKIKEALCKYE